jgi:hypothetical protein
MVPPELQRFVAGRMEAEVVELDAGHASLVTAPDAVSELILRAVEAAGAPTE